MIKLLRHEHGLALVVALGFTVVLTILVASMIGYTSSNSRNANVSGSRLDARAVAESGIAAAASIINTAADASLPTILGCTQSGQNSATPCTDLVLSVPGGTASVHGLYTQGGNSGTWTITSSGSVRNPTGAADLSRSMTATVTITAGGQSNNISVWNYVYATAPQGSGCEVDLTGTNVVIDVPLYVTGDLCLSGTNAQIIENTGYGGQPVDVRVGGTLTYGGSNTTVGTSATPLTSGLVQGGCITNSNSTPHTCTTADKWYVNSTDSPITAVPPTVDYTSWYADASPGPNHACDAAMTPSPVLAASKFDSDTTMNGTTPSFDITGSTYNCITSSGSISYSTATRILSVSGTIFFDGNITSSATNSMFHGKATIYVNGTFGLSGVNASFHAGCPASPSTPTHQCAFSDVLQEWDPNKDNVLVVVRKTGVTAVDFSGTNNQFQGGILCDSTSTIDLSGTNTKVEGPIICGKFKWATNSKLLPLPSITNLPPGAPVPPNAPATISPPVVTAG